MTPKSQSLRVYMQASVVNGKIPKYYHLILHQDMLSGWTLVREWGMQGSSGRVMRNHYPDYAEAELALLRIRDIQIQRGYQVVFLEGSKQLME
ncbi:hypothetical protein MNBD_GAMMA16-1600 [hydrothermal vent metagenome]|uniref:WGR domain-containing protein n=1 Tax=hydrothermal vent metagenome TaxID=652676 RepID=A0A3B0ZMJ6_9ZZZZ